MNILIVFLINGFLLSITPSTVTDSKCSGKSPLIKENCSGVKTPPAVQPQQQPQNGAEKHDDEKNIKNAAPQQCPVTHAC